MDRLIQFGMRHITFFEPFAKYGISYYLNGKLKKFEQQGIISDYQLKTKRLNQWHYKIYLDVDVTAKQLSYILTNGTHWILNLLGRR